MVCLCMRCVRRRKCSLMESCTSVGMSGDVWLIFTAASKKPMEFIGSFTFSVAMVTAGCWELGGDSGGWSGHCSGPQARLRDGLWKRALVCRCTEHSFQEMNVRRPNRARPQTTNRPSRRLKVASGGRAMGDDERRNTQYGQTYGHHQGDRGQGEEREGEKALEHDFSNAPVLFS